MWGCCDGVVCGVVMVLCGVLWWCCDGVVWGVVMALCGVLRWRCVWCCVRDGVVLCSLLCVVSWR